MLSDVKAKPPIPFRNKCHDLYIGNTMCWIYPYYPPKSYNPKTYKTIHDPRASVSDDLKRFIVIDRLNNANEATN